MVRCKKLFSLALMLLTLNCSLFVFAGSTKITEQQKNNKTNITQLNKAAVEETYGKLPMSFEANKGQVDSQVKFLSRGSGYSLFLTSTDL